MDTNEVITLSSDEEEDFASSLERTTRTVKVYKSNLKKVPLVKIIRGRYNALTDTQYKKPNEFLHNPSFRNEKIMEKVNRFKEKGKYSLTKEVSIERNSICFKYKKIPEVVDLVDQSPEELNRNFDGNKEEESKLIHNIKNHSDTQTINTSNTQSTNKDHSNSNLGENKIPEMTDNQTNETSEISHANDVSKSNGVDITIEDDVSEKNGGEVVSDSVGNIVTNGVKESTTEDYIGEIPEFFNEFVNLCGTYENNRNDKIRLMKKLKRRFRETDPEYVKSQELKTLIEKSKTRLNKSNLYLIAKEVTDELSFKKLIPVSILNTKADDKKVAEDKSGGGGGGVGDFVLGTNKINKKNKKILKKIKKRLDKLGDKIHELEKTEVDLWDEEDNTYLQLQRYRERYCQIYKKLCEYTNEVSDAGRVFSRKICFDGSKYPAINSCLEKWLNKTKRFPDFSDIMKLLESQSGSLGLPSNKDLIRVTAIEIFQEVGIMLQRRRKYDSWDTLCGFLDGLEDPAKSDAQLEKALRENYEMSIKKEREIVNHYAEMQEKERLEPEEVPEEEANQSPEESGNEDEKEIEDVEESINKRLDDVIEEQFLEDGNEKEGGGEVSGREEEDPKEEEAPTTPVKESKNNYKNCKSLKWRSKSKEGGNSEDSNLENEKENKNFPGEETKEVEDSDFEKVEDPVSVYYSKLTGLMSEEPKTEASESKETENELGSGRKAVKRRLDEEGPRGKKKKLEEKEGSRVLEIDVEKEYSEGENGSKNVFDVRYCRVEQNFGNLEKLDLIDDGGEEKREWSRRRVFRDLTNVNRLLELNGRRKKSLALFSHSFYHRSLRDFDKPSWKKRFTFNYKFVGLKDQKCALNGEEKTGKGVDGEGGEGEEKESQNGSESGGDEGGMNFFGGHGSGSEEDNNENDEKKKKNGDLEDDAEENKHEEDEEEEETEVETGNRAAHSNNDHPSPDRNENSTAPRQGDPENETKDENSIENTTNGRKSPAQGNNTVEDKIETEEEQKELDEEESCKNVEAESEIPEPEKGESKEDQEVERISNDEQEESNLEIGNDKGDEEETMPIEERRVEEKEEEGNLEIEEGRGDDEEKLKMNFEEAESRRVEEEIGESSSETGTARHEEVSGGNCLKRKEDGDDSEDEDKTERSEENAVEERKDDEEMVDAVELVDEEEEDEVVESEEKMVTNVEEESEGEQGQNTVDNSKVLGDSFSDEEVPACRPEDNYYQSTKSSESSKAELGARKQKTVRNSTSDEERVKKFLLHSPSSISITLPKKLSLLKPPSQAAIQALATLRGLKGISATRVRGRPGPEDDVVVLGESPRRAGAPSPPKQRKCHLPVISNVHSIQTPKILTVEGNAPGFGDNGRSDCDSSSIKISQVWGNLPPKVYRSMHNESISPSCSFRRETSAPKSTLTRKKNAKKSVEYVVLE